MNTIGKTVSLLLFSLVLSGCRTYVSDEKLQEVSVKINRPVKVIVSGLPPKEKSPELILSFDDKDSLRLSGAVSVGASTGDGHFHPGVPIPADTRDCQYDRYGSLEEIAIPIIFSIEDWCGRKDTEQLKEYRQAKQNEIIIAVDINVSMIVSKIPKTTFGIGIGAAQENVGTGIGATWAKREYCNAEIAGEYHFMIEGKNSKKFRVEVDGEQIKVEDQAAAKTVYNTAAERLAREIVYKMLKLQKEGFFEQEAK